MFHVISLFLSLAVNSVLGLGSHGQLQSVSEVFVSLDQSITFSEAKNASDQNDEEIVTLNPRPVIGILAQVG